jgi:hypothetical protein
MIKGHIICCFCSESNYPEWGFPPEAIGYGYTEILAWEHLDRARKAAGLPHKSPIVCRQGFVVASSEGTYTFVDAKVAKGIAEAQGQLAQVSPKPLLRARDLFMKHMRLPPGYTPPEHVPEPREITAWGEGDDE